jgi:hypothetical protein
MADYYPALARAVSSLADNNAPARQELYGHARKIIVEQLLRQEPQKSAPEIMRERAALETAISKIEAESLFARTHPPNAPTPPRLTAAVAGDRDDIGIRRERLANDEAKAAQPALAQTETIEPSKKPAQNEASYMDEMPELLGVMFIRTAFVVGMMAFIGVIYIRGLALVSDNVVGYPVLLVAIAIMLCLFVFLPLAVFRKARIVSGVSFLSSLAYSGLRRAAPPVGPTSVVEGKSDESRISRKQRV